MMPIGAWARAFALTCVIEVPVVVWATRDAEPSALRRVVIAVVGQLATHPLVWFVFPYLPGITGWTSFVASELYATVLEAILYAVAWPRVGTARAFGISAVANAASLAVGLALAGHTP
jgi:hypothetical protein